MGREGYMTQGWNQGYKEYGPLNILLLKRAGLKQGFVQNHIEFIVIMMQETRKDDDGFDRIETGFDRRFEKVICKTIP